MSGPCLSPDVSGHALTPDTRRSLGRPLPHQQADRKWADPRPPELCPHHHAVARGHQVLPALSQSPRHRNAKDAAIPESRVRYPFITHPFATDFPSSYLFGSPFDLHALATPPAFVLSQDQTLRLKTSSNRLRFTRRRSDTKLGLTLPCAREKVSSPGTQAERQPCNPNGATPLRIGSRCCGQRAHRNGRLTSSRRQTCSLVKEHSSGRRTPRRPIMDRNPF